MEELFPEEWQLSKKQKKLLGYGSASVALLYFLYRAYKSDSLAALVELRERLQKSLDTGSKSFLLASELSSTVMRDLQEFLASDSDELPQSLRQLAKLAKSKEVSEATSNLAAAAVRGVFQGPGTSDKEDGQESVNTSGADRMGRVLDLLTSERGMNLVQLAVGVACKSTVKAYCESTPSDSRSPPFWQQLLEFGTTERGEKLFSTSIGTFVREGTKVWMSSLEGVSGWEDFLSSVCKPERQGAVDRMTRTFVNELVVSYLKRSRHGVRPETKAAAFKSQDCGTPVKATSAAAGQAILSKSNAYHGSLQQAACHTAVPVSRHPEWTATLAEAAKHPELRSLILSVAKTATGEGVRSSIFATRDLLLGPPREVSYTAVREHHMSPGLQGVQMDASLQQMSSRNLGTLLLFIFMPIIIFLAGRRAALA